MMIDNPDLTSHAIAAAPPLTVTALSICGVQLSDIAIILTIVYTAMLITHFAWTKWIRPIFDDEETG